MSENEHLTQLAYLREQHPAVFALVANGWTVESAFAHVEGTCDRELCTGTHPYVAGMPTDGDRHDADGKPFIAYFNAGVCVGFIWDGDAGSPVQVQREMGEPIIATFFPTHTRGETFALALDSFRENCDRWIHDNAGRL